MSTEIEVRPDVQALADSAAAHFVTVARSAISARGVFHVALSGGSTPRPLFQRLSGQHRSQIEWSKVQIWWGDDRCVPPDHPDSNYRLAHENLLAPLALPAQQIHRMRGESTDLEAEAARYADEMARGMPAAQGVPLFDLMIQGMGTDGHTASLFPGTGKALVRDRAVVHVVPPAYVKPQVERLSVTAPVIQAAREVHVLVAGADKAAVLQQVLHGPIEPDVRPCSLIRDAHGAVRWILDQGAAAQLRA